MGEQTGGNRTRGKSERPNRLKSAFFIFLGFIAGIFVRGNTQQTGTLGSNPHSRGAIVLTDPTGQTIKDAPWTDITTVINGNPYHIHVVDEEVTLDETDIQRITNGETTIENIHSTHISTGAATKETEQDNDLSKAKIDNVTSWLALATALLALLEKRKPSQINQTQPGWHIVAPPATGFFIMLGDDPNQSATHLAEAGSQSNYLVVYKIAKQKDGAHQ